MGEVDATVLAASTQFQLAQSDLMQTCSMQAVFTELTAASRPVS